MILTDELRKEDQTVRTMLRILDKICQRIDLGDQVPQRDLDEIVELIKVAVQRVHQGREEEVLLSTMEESPVDEHGALAVLVADHRELRRHFTEMTACLARHRRGDTNASRAFAESAQLYSRLLNEHLEIAERDLYKRVDIHLSRKKQDELVGRFIGFGVGADREEGFLRLSRTYLE